MLIRDAEPDDLPAIVAIYNASIAGRMATADTQPVTVESRRAWFDAHDPSRRPLWVAVLDGQIVGWISLRDFYGRPAYHATVEMALYVAPQYQGQGIGRELKEKMIAACPQWHVRNVLSFVFSHNERSIALNRRLGFELWGTLPQVAEMDGRWFDLEIWGLKLPPHEKGGGHD